MRFSIEEKNEGMRYVAAAFVFYFALVSFYINIGEDMTPANYLPWLLPVIGALALFQYGARKRLFSLNHAPHLFAGVLWCVTFPLLYSWSYATPWYVSLIRLDFLCGTGIFLLLASWQSLAFSYGKLSRPVAALFAALDFACLAIPFVQIVYFSIYWHCLTPASLMALYLTNPDESVDFLEAMLGIPALIGIVIAFLAFLWLCYRGNMRQARHLAAHPLTAGKRAALFLLGCVLGVYIPFFVLPETSIALSWKEVSDYVAETQEYSAYYDERFAGLKLDTPENTLAAKAPGTVIVVIGESASRTFMKAYTPTFPYDDTPWLAARMEDPDFVVFRHAYSCWSQTVPVLQRALTEQSQYNDKEFYDSTSLIDVAKKAGYNTYWFSNQGRYGQYDSAITLVAKTADRAEWVDDSYLFTEKYDENLLEYLTQIDGSKNNFIVLHIMGSHIYYNNRYPASFERWVNAAGGAGTNAESYANSILYTDDNLRRIFEYARDNLNLQAMVYFSDHGEDLVISHNPDVFNFHMVRIPMFVYLSPACQAAEPAVAAALKGHESQYFT
ncbi:phosphoethanolamine transferase, partial [uncultured Selenomonas sp.]|uniref:phosphoethanolamine transferase n=1 Tax=uncultured Selenomonas sp. TaxID=159275 RepID=UPI00260B9619